MAQSPTKRSTTPSTTVFKGKRYLMNASYNKKTKMQQPHPNQWASIREHFAGQRSISKFAKYGCFTFVHHLTYRVCRITGYFNISFLNKMEYVFVMTNDVEIRGVSLSTRIYHEIPIKKFTYKKWNKMGPLCVLKFFESNLLKKRRNMRKAAKRRNK